MASKQIDLLASGIVDSSGNILQAGTVEIYEAGTSTPVTVYSDSALSSSLGSTVTLDSRGAKLVFVDGLVDLKLIIKDVLGSTINTYDGLDYSSSAFDLTESNPEFTITNTDQEDTEGGRQGVLRFKGEQSGGELSTLATITGAHDGTSDDQKGKITISVNDGNDGDSPSIDFGFGSDGKLELASIDTTGDATVGGDIIVTGTVDGVDVATLKSDYDTHVSGQSNSHTQIDTAITASTNHIADATIHFTEGSIVHQNISGAGTNTHAQIDTAVTVSTNHVADATIHFTEGSIDHGAISGLGDDDHTQYSLVTGTRAYTGDVLIDKVGPIYVAKADNDTTDTGFFQVKNATGTAIASISANGNAPYVGLNSSHASIVADCGGKRVQQLGAPTANDNAATKLYVDTAVSDEKYKDNIVNLSSSSSLDKVVSIDAVSFKWKDDAPESIGKDDDKGKDIHGFIAQNVEVFLPEAVTTVLDGEGKELHKAIRRDALIPIMWSAIQELKSEIELLKV